MLGEHAKKRHNDHQLPGDEKGEPVSGNDNSGKGQQQEVEDCAHRALRVAAAIRVGVAERIHGRRGANEPGHDEKEAAKRIDAHLYGAEGKRTGEGDLDRHRCRECHRASYRADDGSGETEQRCRAASPRFAQGERTDDACRVSRKRNRQEDAHCAQVNAAYRSLPE